MTLLTLHNRPAVRARMSNLFVERNRQEPGDITGDSQKALRIRGVAGRR
jgi:hypothetical protein